MLTLWVNLNTPGELCFKYGDARVVGNWMEISIVDYIFHETGDVIDIDGTRLSPQQAVERWNRFYGTSYSHDMRYEDAEAFHRSRAERAATA